MYAFNCVRCISARQANLLSLIHIYVEFTVEGPKDAQITIQMENDTIYEVYVDGSAAGGMKTNMSGKLSVSVELEEGVAVKVQAVKRA